MNKRYHNVQIIAENEYIYSVHVSMFISIHHSELRISVNKQGSLQKYVCKFIILCSLLFTCWTLVNRVQLSLMLQYGSGSVFA